MAKKLQPKSAVSKVNHFFRNKYELARGIAIVSAILPVLPIAIESIPFEVDASPPRQTGTILLTLALLPLTLPITLVGLTLSLALLLTTAACHVLAFPGAYIFDKFTNNSPSYAAPSRQM